MADVADNELVTRCLEGDTAAFDRLISRYQKPLFNGCLRMVNVVQDAQDITQTVFLKAYEKLDTYDPRYRLFSWLYRMMVNESLNFLNKRRPTGELDHRLAAPGPSPEAAFADAQLADTIQDALMDLREDYRAVIVLRYFGELSYRELSYVFDLPEKTVKSRLYTARQQLGQAVSRRGIRAHDG